jgi:predicted dehydrogenase
MSKPSLTVGLVGYQFMGKAHSNAYRQVNRFFDLPMNVRMKTICGRTEDKVKAAADTFGWEGYVTDYHEMLADPEIDVIDVATPGNSHCQIVCDAAAAGKTIFCEKPIGNTLEEAEMMHAAVMTAGVKHGVFHNYRKIPAVALMKQMIDSGDLGEIHHVRAVYLQDWIADPQFPLVWRLDKSVAGSGSHGDLNSHLIDMARFLVGEFEEVSGHMHTFVKQRPIAGEIDDKMGAAASSEMGDVTVDDAVLVLAKFRSGAVGTFEATRFAYGHKNHAKIEINGSKGSVIFNVERMNELEYFNAEDPEGRQGFRTIQTTEAAHPYAGQYWPPGHIIGYEQTFMNWVADAVEKSSETRKWISL